MPRVKRGNKRRLKRKKILRRAKGYYLAKSKLYRIAREQVDRSLAFAYRDRRARKRQFRRLWIVRINAAAREHELSYSTLMRGLKLAGVELDRKNLADLAVRDPAGFAGVVEVARQAVLEIIEWSRLQQGITPVGLEQLYHRGHVWRIDTAQVEAVATLDEPAIESIGQHP